MKHSQVREGSFVVRTALVAALAGAAAGTPRPGIAQEAGGDSLQEVVVTTARQREEVLQDVPATVTALTSQTLEQAAVERAGDFIRLTPGVSLVQAAEVADAQVNIRGINGARDAENSFALIVDGILQTNPAAFNREYADLQQIEILKGPQGALYGRNAAAGAVIITTTRPTEELSGLVQAGAGEDSTYTASLVLAGPLSEQAGWKLAADFRKSDGFYENVFLRRDDAVDDFEGWNVNARLLFEPAEGSALDVKAHYGEVEGASISFNPNFLVPGLTFAPLPNAALFNEDVNAHAFTFVPNVDPFNNQEAFDLSAKWEQELAFAKLTVWGLYSDIENDFGSDGTSATYGFFNNEPTCQASTAAVFNAGFQLPPPQIVFFGAPGVAPAAIFGPYTPTTCDGTQYQVRNQEDYSLELRLTSPGDRRFRWLGGLYFLNIDREVGVNTGIDDANGRIARALFVPAGLPNATEQLVWDEFASDIYAAFANVAWDLTESVELALAVRYDREEREVHNLVPTAARTTYFDFNPFDGAFAGNSPLNPALDPAINATGRVPDRELTFSETQPKVSLAWKATPGFTAYANWGVGFKSGGFNNTGSARTVDLFINCFTGRGPGGQTNLAAGACGPGTPNVPLYRSVLVRDEYDEETSSAAEVGFKSLFGDGRFTVEAAAFHTEVDDMQFFEFLVGTFGLLRVVNNIDEVTLEGFEVAGTARVTDRLRLVAGYSMVDSEIDANVSRPASVGNESPYTPDYTATAGLELDAPLGGSGWRLQASAYWNLVGPTWFHVIQAQDNETVAFGTGNYTNAERDSFSTVDARLAAVSDRWSVALVARNLGDEEWLQEVIPAPEFGGAFIHPGSLRRVSVEVGYRF